ncbi:hypothetical protein HZ326_27448 [Fusarium oxysporum f. sp. albedinis]|nr:hypothetical protein HZ326_27448 [Fusarium oxysporum f. sp. albedinis]
MHVIERFIDYIKSSPTLDVCVRNSKDNDINNDIVPGIFYEQVTLYEGLEDLALEFKVKAFSQNHDPENDPKVHKILENENPYYFSIGMKISRKDYYQQDGETFNERINNFDLVRDIEWYIKLAEDYHHALSRQSPAASSTDPSTGLHLESQLHIPIPDKDPLPVESTLIDNEPSGVEVDSAEGPCDGSV